MREYYGTLDSCRRYIEDEDHKAIPLKDFESSFEIQNSTIYTLEIRRHSRETVIVRPAKKIRIPGGEKIFVNAKENLSLECNFEVQYGCMAGRNLVKHVKGKVYIAPIFKNGIITIVTCKNCGPNFGAKPKYKVTPLEEPAEIMEVYNLTNYDLAISTENRAIETIKAGKKKFVGIPLNGVLYVDTVYEEVAYKDSRAIYDDAILRVNGCCIKINNGVCTESGSITGPVLQEPYIRHLGAFFKKIWEEDGDINIWCNTIDHRLD